MTLFMTELPAADPFAAASWYVEALGLRLALRDERRGFVLLEAPGGGRIALKRSVQFAQNNMARLIFQVDDLEGIRRRLDVLGIAVDGPTDHPDERYRSLQLEGPDRQPMTLFCWSDA